MEGGGGGGGRLTPPVQGLPKKPSLNRVKHAASLYLKTCQSLLFQAFHWLKNNESYSVVSLGDGTNEPHSNRMMVRNTENACFQFL